MKIALTPTQLAFRGEVRAFLRPWLHLNKYLVSENSPDLLDFFRAMATRNWLSLVWPVADGGLGRSAMDEFILWNEIAYHRIARAPHSVGIVAKTIVRYGAPEQKKTWLPRIRAMDLTMALTYSEPEAGSDLAAVRCKAERQGDHYVINGNKCWNSRAHQSDYLWLLCRTGEQSARGKALSLIIVPRESIGLRIRPIEVMDGNFFTEITFDNVKVPVENRIGPENGAWAMMGAALADERHVQFLYGRLRRDYEEVLNWARAHGADRDPVVRHRLAELAIDVAEAELQSLRVAVAVNDGIDAPADSAANKLVHTLVCQAIARAAMEFGCEDAVLVETGIEVLWRQSMIETIGGGTTQIMNSVVARQRLGVGGTK